jgi:hypothetical protein
MSLIVDGTTKKMSHIKMPLKSIYNKYFYFNGKNLFMNTPGVDLIKLGNLLTLCKLDYFAN